MSQAVSLPIPCLGTSKPYYSAGIEILPLLNTKAKVALVFSAFLAVVGFALLPSLSHVGVTCLAVAALGVLAVALYRLVEFLRKPDFVIKKLEKLESAMQLAVGIDTSPALHKELVQVIPTIDARRADDRISSVQYHCDKTATFILKTAPHLQFRISSPCARSGSCEEIPLTRLYENKVYAQEVCRLEKYDSLVVSSVKPLYLTVGGLRRLALAETVIQKVQLHTRDLERAVRQMVQFLLKTGGTGVHDPIPFAPLAGGKLALDNLDHLTKNPHCDDSARDTLEWCSILGARGSLLASLDRKDLIDIAFDEFKKLRPPFKREGMYRAGQINKAARLEQLHNPLQVKEPLKNILKIFPEELDINLNKHDYAVVRPDGVRSDGVCRLISLGEVAGSIIEQINRKLEANPTQINIAFNSEDILIGEKLPLSFWTTHPQYNKLQGLGDREWPDLNKAFYWMVCVVLKSLKNKGVISDFTLPNRVDTQVHVRLEGVYRS